MPSSDRTRGRLSYGSSRLTAFQALASAMIVVMAVPPAVGQKQDGLLKDVVSAAKARDNQAEKQYQASHNDVMKAQNKQQDALKKGRVEEVRIYSREKDAFEVVRDILLSERGLILKIFRVAKFGNEDPTYGMAAQSLLPTQLQQQQANLLKAEMDARVLWESAVHKKAPLEQLESMKREVAAREMAIHAYWQARETLSLYLAVIAAPSIAELERRAKLQEEREKEKQVQRQAERRRNQEYAGLVILAIGAMAAQGAIMRENDRLQLLCRGTWVPAPTLLQLGSCE